MDKSKLRKKIIIINPIRGKILSPKKGGDLYIKCIIEDFIKEGYDVIVVSTSCPTIKEERISCYRFSPWAGVGILMLGLNVSYIYALAKALRSAGYRADLALNGSFGAISTYIVSRILNTKMIYIAHNVEVDRYSEGSVFEHEAKFMWFLPSVIHLFEYFAVKADIILSISPDDKKRFIHRYKIPPEKIKIRVPKIKLRYNQIFNEQNNQEYIQLVFHGSYKYIPNKEAINLIEKYISRGITYKNVKFVVFGTDSPKIKRRNFESLGFIKDIYPILSSSDIAIVPLRRGAGVKIKMLDYMAIGLPIVTSKKGARGIEMINGKHGIIVDKVDKEFIKAIEYLIENPKIRKKLGHNSKKLIKTKYIG